MLRRALFEVSPLDPAVFGWVALVLAEPRASVRHGSLRGSDTTGLEVVVILRSGRRCAQVRALPEGRHGP